MKRSERPTGDQATEDLEVLSKKRRLSDSSPGIDTKEETFLGSIVGALHKQLQEASPSEEEALETLLDLLNVLKDPPKIDRLLQQSVHSLPAFAIKKQIDLLLMILNDMGEAGERELKDLKEKYASLIVPASVSGPSSVVPSVSVPSSLTPFTVTSSSLLQDMDFTFTFSEPSRKKSPSPTAVADDMDEKKEKKQDELGDVYASVARAPVSSFSDIPSFLVDFMNPPGKSVSPTPIVQKKSPASPTAKETQEESVLSIVVNQLYNHISKVVPSEREAFDLLEDIIFNNLDPVDDSRISSIPLISEQRKLLFSVVDTMGGEGMEELEDLVAKYIPEGIPAVIPDPYSSLPTSSSSFINLVNPRGNKISPASLSPKKRSPSLPAVRNDPEDSVIASMVDELYNQFNDALDSDEKALEIVVNLLTFGEATFTDPYFKLSLSRIPEAKLDLIKEHFEILTFAVDEQGNKGKQELKHLADDYTKQQLLMFSRSI
ncbi:MAG: hypothetical protein K0R63_930 [Rickettsiales bacterium]|jgi:hypothetical protein|nr:hypothetical protein [Rickettsiales bacterium]